MNIIMGQIGTYKSETKDLSPPDKPLPLRCLHPGTIRGYFLIDHFYIIPLMPGGDEIGDPLIESNLPFPRNTNNAQDRPGHESEAKNQNC